MSEPEQLQHPDIHTTAGKLADLQRRIQEATHAYWSAPSKSSTPRAS